LPSPADWLAGLGPAIDFIAERWELDVGAAFEPRGRCSWTAAARRAGEDVVLKLAWRHPEALHEADGLRVWDGNGAIRLLDFESVDDRTDALLLERCVPGSPLKRRPEEEQDVVIAGILRRLHGEPPLAHLFRPLEVLCDAWSDEAEAKDAPVDPGLLRDGLALFRSLPRSADRNVLLATDLHAENVLAAAREPWLAIDPKPYVGDPTFDVLQHTLNCARLHEDPVALVIRLADVFDLSLERLRLWLFARCVQESAFRPELVGPARRLAP
jgi:streptomycin 6-kinase